jgi:hypothetical protein
MALGLLQLDLWRALTGQGGALFGRLVDSCRTTDFAELSLSGFRYGGLLFDFPPGLGTPQCHSCEMGFAEICGADRVAISQVQEFLFERVACGRCGRGTVFAVRPFSVGGDGRG